MSDDKIQQIVSELRSYQYGSPDEDLAGTACMAIKAINYLLKENIRLATKLKSIRENISLMDVAE